MPTRQSREIVKRCLNFDNPPRMSRDMWVLPWANIPPPPKTHREYQFQLIDELVKFWSSL